MDDIVTRLRECWCPEATSDFGILAPCDHDGVRSEAADEIERLRAENRRLHMKLMVAYSEEAGMYDNQPSQEARRG